MKLFQEDMLLAGKQYGVELSTITAVAPSAFFCVQLHTPAEPICAGVPIDQCHQYSFRSISPLSL